MFEKLGFYINTIKSRTWMCWFLFFFVSAVISLIAASSKQKYGGYDGAIYHMVFAILFFYFSVRSALDEDKEVRRWWLLTYSFSGGSGRTEVNISDSNKTLTLDMVKQFEAHILANCVGGKDQEVILTNAIKLDRFLK